MGDPDVKRWKLPQQPLEKFWGKMTDQIVIPVENGREAYYEEVRNKISIFRARGLQEEPYANLLLFRRSISKYERSKAVLGVPH